MCCHFRPKLKCVYVIEVRHIQSVADYRELSPGKASDGGIGRDGDLSLQSDA